MNWFRANIKHGVRLALLALALQFGLSFGHFHTSAVQAGLALQSVAAQADTPAPLAVDPAATLQASHGDSDQHPGENCGICAVIALAHSLLLAPSPLLLPPQAVDLSYLTADAGFVDPNSARPAFQPRAPPAS